MREVNVLVTGGAGYIGSHTAKQLKAEGFNPVVYDNLVYGHREFVKWGPFIEGDLRETSKLESVIKDYKIEDVIHFAAYAYVGESVKDPEKYYDNNVGGSLSLLRAMKTAGAKRIVFSSTCATYGESAVQPIAETEDQRPINPYGQTKLIVENILKDYSKAYDFDAVALRYFNAAGADADGEIGEDHNPETHLIPLAILAALGEAPELKVFGTDYPTEDGTCVRDYIHVTDLAEAHVAALRWMKSGGQPKFSAFNLGTGQGKSVLDVLQMIEKISGRKVPHQVTDRRPGDPPMLVANPSRAAEILEWRTKRELSDIIRSAYEWHLRR